MSAFVVKNASFWISNGAAAVAVTAAVQGATTELTVTNTLAVGDYAVVQGSGWSSLLGASAWLEACVSGFDIAGGQADSISVGTFCDSSSSLAGAPAASTVSLAGFVDVNSAG